MGKQCSDCYDGCISISTDKCIRYTGIDNNVLGIKTGDSLSYVEQALITFLSSVLDGTGIKLDIDSEIICELVSQYIPECEDLTALDLFKALIQAACDLQELIDTQTTRIDTIEANYDVSCLDVVSTGDGTHAILQAVITKLCTTVEDLEALAIDLDTNYVKLADLNSLIQAYLDSQSITDKASNKMVPHSPIPYVGPLSNYPNTGDSFDITGAGSGYWENVYLCNGLNGTPDKRGRVGVGVIIGVGGGALDPEVDPAVDPVNTPNYNVGNKAGNNAITLITSQLPTHTPTGTTEISPNPHTHILAKNESVGDVPLTADNYMARRRDTSANGDYILSNATDVPDVGKVEEVNLTATTTIDPIGNDEAHDNKQPVIAEYYIIYIP